MTWVRHVTVAQERKSIHERMRSTGVDYRLGPWLLEGWREIGGGGVDEAWGGWWRRRRGVERPDCPVQSPLSCIPSPDQVLFES